MSENPPPSEDLAARGASPQVPDPVMAPLRDAPALIALLAEVTRRPRDEVVERLRLEEADLGRTVRDELARWHIEPYVWSDSLAEFYAQTDAFLFESLVWNVTRHKAGMRRWIAEFLCREFAHPARILMYGDGLGFDSLYLTQAGHRVESFEVSQRCIQFAESLFAASGIDVRIHRDKASLPAQPFDVVICLDVLEHVPDPPALVAEICHALRPGGYLIVHAPFFYVAPPVVTHLRSNRRYSGDLRRLYYASGLRPVDGRPFWDPLVLQKAGHRHTAARRRNIRSGLLRATGWLLAVARYWSAPHSLAARRMVRRREVQLVDRHYSECPRSGAASSP